MMNRTMFFIIDFIVTFVIFLILVPLFAYYCFLLSIIFGFIGLAYIFSIEFRYNKFVDKGEKDGK